MRLGDWKSTSVVDNDGGSSVTRSAQAHARSNRRPGAKKAFKIAVLFFMVQITSSGNIFNN